MTDTFIPETLEGLVDIRCSITGKSLVGDTISEAEFKNMQGIHVPWFRRSGLYSQCGILIGGENNYWTDSQK